jgi:hypothetical protein
MSLAFDDAITGTLKLDVCGEEGPLEVLGVPTAVILIVDSPVLPPASAGLYCTGNTQLVVT